MTKTLNYDLHFFQDLVYAKTPQGRSLLRWAEGEEIVDRDLTAIYQQAVSEGLHCSFETIEVRKAITGEN